MPVSTRGFLRSHNVSFVFVQKDGGPGGRYQRQLCLELA